MNARIAASILTPGLLLLLCAMTLNVRQASAQAGPSITATPTGAQDTYTVAGTGFPANTAIRVVAVTCGELPCPAGGGGVVNPAPVSNATGGFTAVLKLEPGAFRPGLASWLIAAWPGTRGGEAGDAQVKVPVGGASAPKPPATGNTTSSPSAAPFATIMVVALGLATLGASVVGTAVARRR